MHQDSNSPAKQLMLKRLIDLKNNLRQKIDSEILPRIKDERISKKTKELLQERMDDLEKSIREIALLEQRLNRL